MIDDCPQVTLDVQREGDTTGLCHYLAITTILNLLK